MNLSLETDYAGIWLIENTDQGMLQLGHVPWKTIAIHLKQLEEPAYSDNDFVKWQQERQQQEDTIKTLTEKIGELYDEMRYWQQQAMRSVIRD